tara:strand:- start:422 stop:868 length:447 start_codon:yes stop_codon:yes gene_type:complete
MNKFFSQLQSREVNLLIVTAILLAISLVGFITLNIFNQYNFSVKNLDKEKSNYNYVYLRASILNNSEKGKVIDLLLLKTISSELNLSELIKNLDIKKDNDITEITFTTFSIGSSVQFIDEISNKTDLEIIGIDYLNKNNVIQVKVTSN